MAGSKGGKGGGQTQSVFGPRGGMGGGGIFDQLRQQFPQMMPQQPGQFGGTQPVLQPQQPGQFGGQQPVLQPQQPGGFAPPQAIPFGQTPPGETFRPQQSGGIARPQQQQPQPFAPSGPQPILQQSPQGPTQLGPESIINESFGLPQSPVTGGQAQRFQGPMITESFAPTRAAPEALLQSPRSPLGPLVDPRGNRTSGKNFAF